MEASNKKKELHDNSSKPKNDIAVINWKLVYKNLNNNAKNFLERLTSGYSKYGHLIYLFVDARKCYESFTEPHTLKKYETFDSSCIKLYNICYRRISTATRYRAYYYYDTRLVKNIVDTPDILKFKDEFISFLDVLIPSRLDYANYGGIITTYNKSSKIANFKITNSSACKSINDEIIERFQTFMHPKKSSKLIPIVIDCENLRMEVYFIKFQGISASYNLKTFL